MHELDKAPAEPGVYAWFAVPILGAADTSSGSASTAALERHARIMRPASLELRANSSFGTVWEASRIEPATRPTVASAVRDWDDAERVLFVHLLQGLLATFGAPLYIGKAVDQTLRDRLKRHYRDFERSRAGEEGRRNSFGRRAHEAGFSDDDLLVQPVAIPRDDLSAERHSSIVSTLEHFLNTCTQPRLGEV